MWKLLFAQTWRQLIYLKKKKKLGLKLYQWSSGHSIVSSRDIVTYTWVNNSPKAQPLITVFLLYTSTEIHWFCYLFFLKILRALNMFGVKTKIPSWLPPPSENSDPRNCSGEGSPFWWPGEHLPHHRERKKYLGQKSTPANNKTCNFNAVINDIIFHLLWKCIISIWNFGYWKT